MIPIGLVVLMIGNPHKDTEWSLGAIWSLGRVKNSRQKTRETIGSSKVNSRCRVKSHCCRSCGDVVAENSPNRTKDESRKSDEAVV